MKLRLTLLLLNAYLSALACPASDSNYFKADHPFIRYTGRGDFSEPERPKFWAPGIYINIRFQGTYCILEIIDEEKWGKTHNYLQVIVDNKQSYRIQLKEKQNRIVLASGLKNAKHSLVICKNTEADIGYIQPLAIICNKLLRLPEKSDQLIEFFGDSITCGMGNDDNEIPCNKREWYDQHNAYNAYGPVTARNLNARWLLSSVSGIGLIHSCCNKSTIMPQVFDKINMAENKLTWDFNQYQPDIASICLGQNDGIQDSAAFCSAYIRFIGEIRTRYPEAVILLLNSPMADAALDTILRRYITAVKVYFQKAGDKKTDSFFFSRRFNKGCDTHPDTSEHLEMATELTRFIKKRMNW